MKTPIHRSKKALTYRDFVDYETHTKNELFRQIRIYWKRLIKEKGVTIEDLATRLNYDVGNTELIIKGEIDISMESLTRLARAIGCRVDVSLDCIEASGKWALPKT